MSYWEAFTPSHPDWEFDEPEAREALRLALREWRASDRAVGINALLEVLSGAGADEPDETLIDRLIEAGATIRLDGEHFEEHSLPVLISLMTDHPQEVSVGEDMVATIAGLFFSPDGYYPWRQLQPILDDPLRASHARDAAAHHLMQPHNEGDPLWPLMLLCRLAGRDIDAQVLGRFIDSEAEPNPAIVLLVAEGLARCGLDGLPIMGRLLTSPSRGGRVAGILSLGFTFLRDVQDMLEAIFHLDPQLQPLIATAWAWTAAENDVAAFHERLYLRSDPGQRADVGEAWLVVTDPFRRPRPRLDNSWYLHFLPPLPDEVPFFPHREWVPLVMEALAGSVDELERQGVLAVEDAVGGPSTLQEWTREWEVNAFDRFESDGQNVGVPAGTPVLFDKMGTFFVHQRMLVLGLADARKNVPLERVAVEIWERAVETMATLDSDDDLARLEDLRLLVDTAQWGAARGAATLHDVDKLLAEAVIRAMTWVLDDPLQARVIEREVAREAAENAGL